MTPGWKMTRKLVRCPKCGESNDRGRVSPVMRCDHCKTNFKKEDAVVVPRTSIPAAITEPGKYVSKMLVIIYDVPEEQAGISISDEAAAFMHANVNGVNEIRLKRVFEVYI